MRVNALAACLILFTASGAASADAPPGTDHDKAVAAFEEGRRLLEAGHCDTGILKLEESLRYEPSIGARVSLADCLEAASPLAAWFQLREAVRLAYLNHDDRLAVVEKRAAALEPRLPLLRVVVRAHDLAEPGFELRLDGEIVDPFFYKDGLVATTPGDHEIVASTPERRWSSSVVTANGATKTVTVELADRCGDTTPRAPLPSHPPVVAPAPARAAARAARSPTSSRAPPLRVSARGSGSGFSPSRRGATCRPHAAATRRCATPLLDRSTSRESPRRTPQRSRSWGSFSAGRPWWGRRRCTSWARMPRRWGSRRSRAEAQAVWG